MKFRKGDRVWFTGVARLVNEGTVESIDGAYIKVKANGNRTEYLTEAMAFPTREELQKSEQYSRAWFAQRERQARRQRQMPSFTRMAEIRI